MERNPKSVAITCVAHVALHTILVGLATPVVTGCKSKCEQRNTPRTGITTTEEQLVYLFKLHLDKLTFQ